MWAQRGSGHEEDQGASPTGRLEADSSAGSLILFACGGGIPAFLCNMQRSARQRRQLPITGRDIAIVASSPKAGLGEGAGSRSPTPGGDSVASKSATRADSLLVQRDHGISAARLGHAWRRHVSAHVVGVMHCCILVAAKVLSAIGESRLIE